MCQNYVSYSNERYCYLLRDPQCWLNSIGILFQIVRKNARKFIMKSFIRQNTSYRKSIASYLQHILGMLAKGHFVKVIAGTRPRCACILASGGTILLLSAYWDPDGIKIDSVGTNRRKWRAVSNNVGFFFNFISWKQRNDITKRIPR